MLCRIVSSDIALRCWAAGAAKSIMPGTFCAIGRGRGANQPSCGYEFAIISRAASPYDCQAKVVPTPTQKMARKRERAREARLRSGGCPLGNGSSRMVGRIGGGSSDGSMGNKPS